LWTEKEETYSRCPFRRLSHICYRSRANRRHHGRTNRLPVLVSFECKGDNRRKYLKYPQGEESTNCGRQCCKKSVGNKEHRQRRYIDRLSPAIVTQSSPKHRHNTKDCPVYTHGGIDDRTRCVKDGLEQYQTRQIYCSSQRREESRCRHNENYAHLSRMREG
jgi:hypothetical protein